MLELWLQYTLYTFCPFNVRLKGVLGLPFVKFNFQSFNSNLQIFFLLYHTFNTNKVLTFLKIVIFFFDTY